MGVLTVAAALVLPQPAIIFLWFLAKVSLLAATLREKGVLQPALDCLDDFKTAIEGAAIFATAGSTAGVSTGQTS